MLSARLEPSCQEPPLRIGTAAGERRPERLRSVVGPAEIQQQLTANRQQQMIVTQLGIAIERSDRRQCVGRTVDFCDRDRAIQRHDGRCVEGEELIVELVAIVTDSCYALLAGAVGPELRRSVRVARIERYGAGGVYIGLGLTAAFADRR